MPSPIDALNTLFRKLAHIDHAITFLQWDHMVMMPAGGSGARSEAIAELAALHHDILCSPATADLLHQAQETSESPLEQRSVLEMARQYNQAVCLSSDLVKAKTLAGSKCEHDWRLQRKNNDWQGFVKNFREVVRLAREEAQARSEYPQNPFPTPYDAMLDVYCTGDSARFISELFDELKAELPALIERILDKQAGETIPDLSGDYPIHAQQELNRRLMAALGFDFSCGRIDVSAHPFSTGCRGDQRITTRFRTADFFDALLATAHETGHAGYESGLPTQWDGLPIGQARNLCIHESQSLFFEKQIFLAKPFFLYFCPAIKTMLNIEHGCENLWRAATRVAPSYIRVEADEATYPLHVILRYEIESGLINAALEVEDIPELWDQKMRTYLGITTKDNYRDGCMQDMHWTDGSFGYFPAYTLGALNSAQLAAALSDQYPDWRNEMAHGNIAYIRSWLTQQVWNKGSSMDGQELMVEATGEQTNPSHFLNHLKKRYLEDSY